ncbi:kinase-like domain-containing protein [Halteromyces radiatus]|uniref:kinase-like domain-containing protein n=1 Tax=Halteromyces radiatus TaxID=101107 RepID=UPI00221FC1BC|nr:kinase-like domain-containing protein [Halteromyces radiatus]KAI8086322.1 kinase-like domain-containing protein [Halteromyces radiatus]
MPTIISRTSFQLPTPPSTSPPMTSRRLSSATTVVMTPPSPTKKIIPWRPPGSWEMPDIIHETWKQKQLLLPKQPTPPPENKLVKPPNMSSPKVRWVYVGKAPDLFPLPPPIRKPPKRHAEFDSKLRKVLPRPKILDVNPKDYYTGTEQVGSGANGAVIRAVKKSNSLPSIQRKQQQQQQKPSKSSCVAIKRCFIEDHDTHHHSYVLRELRIMGCLSHDNLIQLQEACLYDDHLWMAMELMACSVFGLLFNTTVGLSEAMTIFIAKECLQGLVYLHSKNYMHRDVKCENILLGHQGQVKLADFGLATPLTIQNSSRLGTAKWMAPEVVAESPYNENVDIWSLGITMIEMMDRVPPLYYLENSTEIYREILYGKPPTFNFATPSTAMVNILEWILNADADDRPMAKDVLTNIQQFIDQDHLKCAKKSDLASVVQQVFPIHH